MMSILLIHQHWCMQKFKLCKRFAQVCTLQHVDMSAYTESRSERLKSRWSTVDNFLSNQLHSNHEFQCDNAFHQGRSDDAGMI